MNDQKIFLLMGLTGPLLYFTGRIYYEWYYHGFGINYKTLEFNHFDCLFSSYTSIFLSLSFMPLIYSIGLYSLSKELIFLCLSLFHFLISFIIIPFFWHIKFKPEGNTLEKTLGSKDVLIVIFGIVVMVLLFIFYLRSSDKNIFYWPVHLFQKASFFSLIILSFVMFILFCATAFFEGNYQSRAAIEEGKMGILLCQIKGNKRWYIHVVRTNDGRNYLFDKTKKTSLVVKDDDIEHFDSYSNDKIHQS